MAVFVSHSSKDDAFFVRLLVRMLEFHGVDYWYSRTKLRGGDHFAAEIDAGIQSADVMLLIASENSLQSPWVTHEIQMFRDARPAGRVIPLIISDVNPNKLNELGIGVFQYIRFDECLLTGFELLFQVFGYQFLYPRLSVRKQERRANTTRSRLRFAFWDQFHRASGIGKFEELDIHPSLIEKLIGSVRIASASFVFRDREDHRVLDREAVVSSTGRDVCRDFRDTSAKAIIVVETIAESLWERYEIVPIERRANKEATGLTP